MANFLQPRPLVCLPLVQNGVGRERPCHAPTRFLSEVLSIQNIFSMAQLWYWYAFIFIFLLSAAFTYDVLVESAHRLHDFLLFSPNICISLVVPTKNFFNREFSFTLASDVYIRYNSFQDDNELRKEIARMQPVKIDIGAVYTTKARF